MSAENSRFSNEESCPPENLNVELMSDRNNGINAIVTKISRSTSTVPLGNKDIFSEVSKATTRARLVGMLFLGSAALILSDAIQKGERVLSSPSVSQDLSGTIIKGTGELFGGSILTMLSINYLVHQDELFSSIRQRLIRASHGEVVDRLTPDLIKIIRESSLKL